MDLDIVNEYLTLMDSIFDAYDCFEGIPPTKNTLEDFRVLSNKISTFDIQRITDGIISDPGKDKIAENLAIVRFKIENSRGIPALQGIAGRITDENFLGDDGYREDLFIKTVEELQNVGESGYHVFSEDTKEYGILSENEIHVSLILFRYALVNANKTHIALAGELSKIDSFISEPQQIEKNEHGEKQTHFAAKYHVLTYILECHATGKILPSGNKKELEKIGNDRIGNGKGNRFYKLFNETYSRIDSNSVRQLHNEFGDNWAETIISLSKEPDAIKQYLKQKKLI